MKKLIIALMIAGILIFGCLGGGQQPGATATPAPTPVSANIDPQIDQQIQSSADQVAQLDKMTQQLDSSGMQVSNNDLNALG